MVLLGVLLVAGLFILSPGAGAQTATPAPAGNTAAGGGEPAKPKGLLSIIPNDGVTWTISALSFIAVTLIVQGFIKTRSTIYMPPASVNAMQDMITNRQFKELIEFTETDPSFVAKALNPALKRAPSFNAMKEALETAVGEETANSFRRIEYLNIIGNMGPLLGLLGTVLGMIQAFSAMQAAGGQANPADLAGGISTALAHTFLGLALAIPCLAAFGILRTLTDRLTVEAALKSEELLLMTKPPEGKPASVGAPAAVAASPVARPAPSPSLSK
jgi:biopolymer transport protein ExbB